LSPASAAAIAAAATGVADEEEEGATTVDETTVAVVADTAETIGIATIAEAVIEEGETGAISIEATDTTAIVATFGAIDRPMDLQGEAITIAEDLVLGADLLRAVGTTETIDEEATAEVLPEGVTRIGDAIMTTEVAAATKTISAGVLRIITEATIAEETIAGIAVRNSKSHFFLLHGFLRKADFELVN